jgi:signal transduction histidine kinase
VKLNRWTLDQLVAWIGTAALLVLFVPGGFYLVRTVSLLAEHGLAERGESLARTLASQVVDPMLVEDSLALHGALHKAASADAEIRYIAATNLRGDVVAHTFDHGCPSALVDIWQKSDGQVTRFRTKDEPLMDVGAPILSGQLGTLHVGMCRSRALASSRRIIWMMGVALAGALFVVLAGARLVAARVSRPLHQLEAEVSRFPAEAGPGGCRRITGTHEVEFLAKGFSDMTERLGALEAERTATQERMVHAERLATLGEVAAGLAHEVHNPLDGMLECVRYLDEDPEKSERGVKYYPLLQDGLGRIAHVMREMLAFARSGQEVSVEPRPTADLIETLGTLVKTHLDGRKVRLQWQPPGRCFCLCDQQGLAQAALNLMLNAADAAEESDDPAIRVEAICDDQWVYLVVEDSGSGVPPDVADRIFEPFFSTKPINKGTGLGLSVSRQLIRSVGGDVTLSPEPSSLGGARFVVRLQKAPSPEGQDDCCTCQASGS